MYYAIDRRTINDQLFGGKNRILWNPPGFKEYDDLNKYQFDPQKAKDLLAAAEADGKFDPSKTIRFMYATDLADGGKIAPIVKQQLEAVGFKIELNAVDIDTYNTLATSSANRDKYDMSFGAGGSEGLSPSRSQIYFHCGDEDPVASAGYYNCDLRDLFLKARTQVDPAAQDDDLPPDRQDPQRRRPAAVSVAARRRPRRQQARPGSRGAELRALRHHRRLQLVCHARNRVATEPNREHERVGARRPSPPRGPDDRWAPTFFAAS